MRPPKLRPSRSIGRRVMAFRIFSNNDRFPFWILKILIYDHVTVIVVRICCCIPNFIKIGSRGWPLDAHNCWMSSAPLLRNGRPLPWQPHYGGHVRNVMECDQPSFFPISPLLCELWYHQYVPAWRLSAILNFINFNIWSCDCHCGPNVLLCTTFHRNRFTCSVSRGPKLLNVPCAIARQRPLPWQPHHGGHVKNMMGMTTQVASQSVHC